MEIVWSKLAKELLQSVLDYESEQLGESVALKTLEKIDAKVRRLALYPQIGVPDWNLSFSDSVQVRHLNLTPKLFDRWR